MRRIAAKLVTAVFLVAAGCTPPPSAGEAAPTLIATLSATPTAVDVPVLSFNADWSVQQSGTLVAGGPATIHYDIRRLPACRTEYMGQPAWDIGANWSVDGGAASNRAVTTVVDGQRVGTDITIQVPQGRDLALWFHSSDESDCSQWDSNSGSNYHFPVATGAPAIRFPYPGYAARVEGALVAGGPIVIDYDLRRLSACRQEYKGYPSWDVTLFYRFDDAPATAVSLTRVDGIARVAAPATLQAPTGAHTLTAWFENSDITSCTAWDSLLGANYVFALQ